MPARRRPRLPGILATIVTITAAVLALITIQPALAEVDRQPRTAADPVRIMALGDSITGSPGCWRALLWRQLQTAGHTDTDFVGTLPPQGCGFAYDGENEGHGGFLATNIANQSLLPGWLSATDPDVVLMHLGTNDVWSNIPPATILAAFSTLVDHMRASNPAMRILVAQIIPVDPPSCAECAARTVAFNAAIPAWAASRSTAASPITVVDQWTGFVPATDTGDGVHPNAAGDAKIADRWFAPLVQAITGVPAGTPSATPSATPSVSPPGAGCAATYQIVGQWAGGFQGEVTVANAGAAASRSWSARFTFGAGQRVSQMWGGNVTQSGADVTVSNAEWNGALAPGASTTVGFIGSWTQSNPAPTTTCTFG
ncbi:cellulose binding domain-containing protein [Catenuloplanes atrovinosus]|uniref:Lysophospholipase L1-like esterase n=1 Tax=Catenuloplanes atrovinosus TaxID=137266 RepID=A0AAE3YL84_9ACTN|nr:cellulose binding domain-containing protein [Catenuloplanes atrovinosus]MDR7273891.1 lysophospholipase L1-like esterase [Catenuloplanes atrovinosus]